MKLTLFFLCLFYLIISVSASCRSPSTRGFGTRAHNKLWIVFDSVMQGLPLVGGYNQALLPTGDHMTMTIGDPNLSELQKTWRKFPFFFYGTVTHMFTVTSILKLADRNLLLLEDKISKFLPLSIVRHLQYGNILRVHELLAMRSGIVDYFQNFKDFAATMPKKEWTPEELINLVPSKAEFRPGTKHSISSTNTVILGLIYCNITGINWKDFRQQEVISKELAETFHFPINANISDSFIRAYQKNKTTEKVEDVSMKINPSFGWASANSLIHFKDLGYWLRELFSQKTILSENMLKKMMDVNYNSKPAYGLGIECISDRLGIDDTLSIFGYRGNYLGTTSLIGYIAEFDVTFTLGFNDEQAENYVDQSFVYLLQQFVCYSRPNEEICSRHFEIPGLECFRPLSIFEVPDLFDEIQERDQSKKQAKRAKKQIAKQEKRENKTH